MRTAIAVLVGTLAATSAVASDTAIEFRYGERGGISLKAVSLRFGELWSGSAGRWEMQLQPVVEGGSFRHGGSRAPRDSVSYGGAGVGFRMVRAGAAVRPYAELGLGGTLFSRTTLGGRELSTRFQFSEWIGAGLELGSHFNLGWRYSHYSNAGIKRPNDGIDIHQIVVGARF